jgi:hypothetical protein
MVERLEDKSQKNLGTSLGKREADAWNKLVMFLRVVDTFLLDEFQKRGPKSFTWSKKNPLVAWSRLDCFYVNSSIQVQGGTHRIWPTMGHVLNHAPIFLQIYFKKSRKPNHIPFNLYLIHNDICKQQFVNSWKESIEDSLKY